MSFYEDEDFEELARRYREELGIDEQLQLNMVEILRECKFRGYIVDYVRLPDEKMPDAEARFDPHERKVYICESTYQGANKKEPRSNWAIAHELGHWAFGHQQIRNRSAVASKIERIAPTIRKDETQAHRFAASFLAPFHRANFTLATTAQEIADRFGISLRAANLRLEEFVRIYRRSNQAPRALPPGVIDFLKEAQKKGHKVTSLPPPQYEGEICPGCCNFTMVRTGTCMKCDNCGTITGDG
jgi:Zn-dependent peptidase ImmA (M78 family)